MNNNKHRFQGNYFVFIVCLCVIALLTGGCEPLRKKFTRKKKDAGDQSRKEVPILEPIDYPEKEVSPLEKYKYHYSLWKIWDRDLLQVVDQDGSDKRQAYLLNQSVLQLEEMGKLLVDEKREEFSVLVNNLRDVQKDFEKPAPNTFSIRMKIERNASKIRNGFAPDHALVLQEP